MATILVTMFATFVAFVLGVMTITEAVNKLFKVDNSTVKLIISWVLSLALAAAGFALQLGFFADCGDVSQWQGWVKACLIGIGCGLCANGLYDRNEMWHLLELIFPIFKSKKNSSTTCNK